MMGLRVVVEGTQWALPESRKSSHGAGDAGQGDACGFHCAGCDTSHLAAGMVEGR